MPRATANSSSTIRMVAATARRSYTGAPRAAGRATRRAQRGAAGPAGARVVASAPLQRRAETPVAPRPRPRAGAPPPERITTMPDRPRLAAASRTVTGKKVARLRQEGRCPPSSTATARPASPSPLDAHEFDLLRRHVGASTLVDLAVDGKKSRARCSCTASRCTRSPSPAARRPVRRPDDRGAHRRGAARRRPAPRRPPRPAARSSTRRRASRSARCRTSCPSRCTTTFAAGRLRRHDHGRRPRVPEGVTVPGRAGRGHRPRPRRRASRRRRRGRRGRCRGRGGCREAAGEPRSTARPSAEG